jgi:hypothetical protein
VGHGLGAGSAARAKLAARAAATALPFCWVVLALILCLPPSQLLIIRAFSGSSEPVLLRRLQHLLRLMAVLVFFDGAQGGEAAAGSQQRGPKKRCNGALVAVQQVSPAGSIAVALMRGRSS